MDYKKIANLLLDLLIFFLLFKLPLEFALLFKNANVFELNKLILLKSSVSIMIFLVLVLMVWDRGFRGSRLSYIKKGGWHIYVPLFYLLGLFLSFYYSHDRPVSWYGLYDRQAGLLTFVYFSLFYLLLLLVLNRRRLRIAARAVVWSSAPACLYAFIQKAGLDPLIWFESTQDRVTGTFGQPNFFAAYLLMVMPITVYLLFRHKHRLVKALYYFLFLSQILCVLFTESRAALLVLALAAAVCALYLIYTRVGRKFTIIFLVFCILLALGAAAMTFWGDSSFGLRLKMLLNPAVGSAASRLENWDSGWSAFTKRPLLGYGLESQGKVYAGYYDNDWAYHNNINSIPNRAHNLILDALLTGGLVGAFVLLSVFAYFIYTAYTAYKRRAGALPLAIAVSLVLYFLFLQLNFSIITTDLYFWLFGAMAVYASGSKPGPEAMALGLGALKNRFSRRAGAHILTFVFFFLLLFQIGHLSRILAADYYFRQIQEALAGREYYSTFMIWEELENLGVRDDHYKQWYGRRLAQELALFHEATLTRPAEVILAEISGSITGRDYNSRLSRGLIYFGLYKLDKMAEQYSDLTARDGDGGYFARAENEFALAAEAAPGISSPYTMLARLYEEAGLHGRAAGQYEKALSVLPDLSAAVHDPDDPGVADGTRKYVNKPHRLAIETVAAANFIGVINNSFKAGRPDLAAEYLEKAGDYLDENEALLESVRQAASGVQK